uniref:hypothetical protein n=1 Tax=Amycolatopsis sp. CA-290885 TaxID=3239925 RepID=UPI003F4980E6
MVLRRRSNERQNTASDQQSTPHSDLVVAISAAERQLLEKVIEKAAPEMGEYGQAKESSELAERMVRSLRLRAGAAAAAAGQPPEAAAGLPIALFEHEVETAERALRTYEKYQYGVDHQGRDVDHEAARTLLIALQMRLGHAQAAHYLGGLPVLPGQLTAQPAGEETPPPSR